MKRLLFLFSIAVSVNGFGQTYWNGSTSAETTTPGDCSVGLKLSVIGGQIDFPMVSATATRQINGLTDFGSLGMYIKSSQTDGANVEVFGKNHSSFAGSVHYNSYYGPNSESHPFGHIFQHLDYSGPSPVWNYLMSISKTGKVVINDNLIPAPADYLTVKQSLGFCAPTAGTDRAINAYATESALRINNNNSSLNGPAIELYGKDYPLDPIPGLYNTFKGRIHYNSYGTDGYGHVFQNASLAGAFMTSMGIRRDGKVVISDMLEFVPSDNLTVKESIGYFSTTPSSERKLNGYAPGGSLRINNDNSSENGPAIELYGRSFPDPSPSAVGAFNGSMHYNSFASDAPYGHLFQTCIPGTPATWNVNMGIRKDGKVVISDAMPPNPSDRLTVKDNIGFSSGDGDRSINGHSINGRLGLYSNNGPSDGSSNVEVYGHAHPSFDGQVHYNAYGAGTSWGHVFQTYFFTGGTPAWKQRMVITKDGRVGIGENIIAASNMPDGYLLYVEKGILTEHVKVAAKGSTSWADFVFNKDYELMPLSEVEAYVNKYKHLPEIPSAAEVEENGIDLGETDAKLLQKIEELTLYVIEQQKRIEKLEKQVKNTK